MMRYVKLVVLFVVVSACTLYALYFIYRVGYRKYYAHEISMMDERINGTQRHDILVLGSSRVYYHVNPKVLDSVTGMASYNAGIAGAKFPEMKMILQCYLATHQPPKYLVMDVPHAGFDPDQRPFYNPNLYYPYLDNEIVFNSLLPHTKADWLKRIPPLQLTEIDDAMRQGALLGLLGQRSLTEDGHYKGYLKNGTDTITLPFRKEFKNIFKPVRQEAIGYFKEILDICKERNIKVLATYPPIYRVAGQDINPAFFPAVQEVCSTYRVPFINYWQIPLCDNHALFDDELHLNKVGADIFSAILGKDLLNSL